MATQTDTNSLTKSIEALRGHDFSSPCSGYSQDIYLDPEARAVDVFACVGSGWPVRAHHNIDVHVISIPADAVADSVADCLLEHADLLATICDEFKGTRWDGSNHVGDWGDGDYLGSARESLGYVEWPEIACAWEPEDWFVDNDDWAALCGYEQIDPERGEEAIPELAEGLRDQAAADGHVLKDLDDYLLGIYNEWRGEQEAA
jgi:hypothetical protein